MNKKGRAEPVTIGGSFALIIAGILFLSMSSTDTSGILTPVGVVFIICGVIGFIAVLIKLFK